MIVDQVCPKCGTALSEGALEGLCRKCLGGMAFGAEPTPNGDTADFKGWTRLGDYQLLGEIARGGMGVVYQARQLGLNRIVALKVLLHGPFSSDEFVQRFRTEAAAVAALRHPNIVAVYEFGEQDGHQFLAMEFIEGKALSELARDKPLPAKRAAAYVKTTAEAIHYAHEQGILHRDLKPSNVLLDLFDQPRVTDFGLAKLRDSDTELTTTGQVLGSPNHMPPEQASGNVAMLGPQGDVYSLGAILYQLLTTRPPFQGETLSALLLQVQNAEPIPPRRLNPGLPIDLQTICLKCLQKEPARRYATAKELADDLGRFVEGKPVLARPVTPMEKLWLWSRRRPMMAALSGGLVTAVLLGLAGILWQWRRAEEHAEGEASQRRLAQEYAQTTRLNLYAADISLAFRAIHDGDYGLARRTLAALKPNRGETDARGFEWRYLWNLCRGQQVATLAGHAWIVTCAAFSPDGKLAATGSQDGTARVWDVAKRQCVKTLPIGSGAVWSVNFSPESDLLLTADSQGKVILWRTTNWQRATNFPGKIASLAKTGSRMAVSESNPLYWESVGKVSVWDYRTGQRLVRLEKAGRTVALSADGQLLAVAGIPTGIGIHEAGSGKLLRNFRTEHPVWSLNFSPDGKRLLSAGWSSDVWLWDVTDHGQSQKLAGLRATVWSASFSPDGSTILTTSSDQSVRLWDAATLQLQAVLLGHDSEVWCGAFSADGNMLVTGGKDQNVMLWSAHPGTNQHEFPNTNKERPVLSADGSRIATIIGDDAARHSTVWRLNDGKRLVDLDAIVLGFMPDRRPATWDQDQTGLSLHGPDGAGQERTALAGIGPDRPIFEQCRFSRDGKAFFAVESNGKIRVWDAGTGKALGVLQGPSPPLRNAALSPRGKYLALCLERENVARLYEVASGRQMPLSGHHDFVSGLAFSADNAMLATGSMDGTIRLWDTATGNTRALLPGHLEEVTDVSFSPDGRTLASLNQGGSVKLWHLPTQRELLSLDFAQAGLFLDFTADGRYLAVTTQQNSVRLLDGSPAEAR
jgi:WD40 repeat protein/serine/threonine protein kinase